VPQDNVYFFVDETGADERSEIVAAGCIIVDDANQLREAVLCLWDDVRHHPILKTIPSITAANPARLLHYAEDHYEVRLQFIEALAPLTFEAYVCYARKEHFERDRGDWYDRLVHSLLFQRVRANRFPPNSHLH